MKWKICYYDKWCKQATTIYLPTKEATLKFLAEKGMDQVMSYTQIEGDGEPVTEPFEFEKEE